jgi:hypothetical protein
MGFDFQGISASDVEAGTVKIVYDESKTNGGTITNAITNAGYKGAR